MKKLISKIIFLGFIFLILFLFVFLINKYQSSYFKKIGSLSNRYLPEYINSSLQMIFNNKTNRLRIKNDYNTKFLPFTQFNILNFEKKKLDFIKQSKVGYNDNILVKKFFIELDNNKIFFLSENSNLYFNKIKNLEKNKINAKQIQIEFNTSNNSEKILDFEIQNKDIYISRKIIINSCHYLILDKGILDLNKIKFKEVFKSKKCMKDIQAGKIEVLSNDDILLTTAADILKNDNEVDAKPQDANSIFGKILLINSKNQIYSIFSSGHRNSLGLFANEEVVLSTENGPRGGDEINLELKGENYGWDQASYGARYGKKNNLGNKLYGDHQELGFKEPIFSFVPSLGITEIIKLNNNFEKNWKNNFLIGTLNSLHLLRVKFNKEYSKVDYFEKIFIGERIRDLDYDPNSRQIFLTLENTGSLGVLSKIN